MCGMKIFIKVKLNAREAGVQKTGGIHFTVSVKERPIKGKANRAIIRALAKYFGVSPSRVQIISGSTSRQKVVEVVM